MGQQLLHDFIIEDHIKNALKEDIGFGDITTDFLYNEDEIITAKLNTRVDAIVCGLNIFKKVFELLSDKVQIEMLYKDGDFAPKGSTIAKITFISR